MDDLIKLNRRIAAQWFGRLDAGQQAYLNYASVCIGEFTPGAAQLTDYLARPQQPRHQSLAVAKLNRQYLRFSRLAGKDMFAGRLEIIIRLGITLEQAEVLGKLTNEDISRLAFGWDGPVVQFSGEAFMRGVGLHHGAVKYHAAAMVATPPTG